MGTGRNLPTRLFIAGIYNLSRKRSTKVTLWPTQLPPGSATVPSGRRRGTGQQQRLPSRYMCQITKTEGRKIMVKMKFKMIAIAAYQPQVRIGIALEPEQDKNAMAVVKDVLKIEPADRPIVCCRTSTSTSFG
mmetsp:Transcript_16240/g.47050  ORF Transcript_16240/g.47050 Transcript_16240/m.47050 type:complete len:133 (+) Transcript_16240:1544-1942(+)